MLRVACSCMRCLCLYVFACSCMLQASCYPYIPSLIRLVFPAHTHLHTLTRYTRAEYSNGAHATCTKCSVDADCPTGRSCWAKTYCTSTLYCGDATDAACRPSTTSSTTGTGGGGASLPTIVLSFNDVTASAMWVQIGVSGSGAGGTTTASRYTVYIVVLEDPAASINPTAAQVSLM